MLRAQVLGVATVVCVACGCGQKPVPATQTASPPTAKAPLAGWVDPGKAPPAAADPAAAAGEFLKALKAGTATAAQLTPAFKKLLAPDAAGGAADWEAEQYLKSLAADAAEGGVVSAPAGPDATLVCATSGQRRTLVKLVRTPAGTLADWVSDAHHGAGTPVTAANLPVAFPALAFLDAILTGGPRLEGRPFALATALLTPEARDRPSPPLAFRISRFRGDGTTGTVAGVAGETVTGTVDGPGGKRPFTVKLALVRGEYRVADFAAE